MRVRLKVKEVAQKQGVSMGKLSRKSDISYKTIKGIFDNPYYSITTTTLEKLAAALGVKVVDLIEEEEGDRENLPEL